MKSILLALALVVCVTGSVLDRTKFSAWKAEHGKTYESSAHEARAFANFRATLARLKTYKTEGMGLNSMSDLSPEEFKAKYLSSRVPSRPKNAKVLSLADEDTIAAAPTSFDWRTYDAKSVTPVKDQGDCGSCWAFSATEALESQWYLATKTQVILAPQQTVSCDDGDDGCNGGDLPTAYAYMEKAGVEDEKSYPYTSGDSGETGTCKYKSSAVKAYVSDFAYAVPPCMDDCEDQSKYEAALKVAVAANSTGAHGPAAICVNAEIWQDWVGPAPLTEDCEGAYDDLDHCVQVVGYNGTATKPYWIVRNSWGTSWGQKGYIYLPIGINQCGIADEAILPVAAPKLASAPRHRKHF